MTAHGHRWVQPTGEGIRPRSPSGGVGRRVGRRHPGTDLPPSATEDELGLSSLGARRLRSLSQSAPLPPPNSPLRLPLPAPPPQGSGRGAALPPHPPVFLYLAPLGNSPSAGLTESGQRHGEVAPLIGFSVSCVFFVSFEFSFFFS